MVAQTMTAPGTMAEAVAFPLDGFLALEGDDEQYDCVCVAYYFLCMQCCVSQAGNGGREGVEGGRHNDGKAVRKTAPVGFEHNAGGLVGGDGGWSLRGDTRSPGQAS